jgi:undecaprenyl pyrophosphate synthase
MSQLWDIHQLVRTLAEDIARIHCQEITSEDIEDFIYTADK